jgi:hypothetical protein
VSNREAVPARFWVETEQRWVTLSLTVRAVEEEGIPEHGLL